MSKIPRKLKQINGYVLSRVGPLPYETDQDKDQLTLIANIIDHALKQKHILFYKGQSSPSWGQGVSEKEQQSWSYAFEHKQINEPKTEEPKKQEKKIEPVKEPEKIQELQPWWERLLQWIFK